MQHSWCSLSNEGGHGWWLVSLLFWLLGTILTWNTKNKVWHTVKCVSSSQSRELAETAAWHSWLLNRNQISNKMSVGIWWFNTGWLIIACLQRFDCTCSMYEVTWNKYTNSPTPGISEKFGRASHSVQKLSPGHVHLKKINIEFNLIF